MAFFFHPDFTVGPGVSPSQPEQAFMISLTPGSGSRTLPPVGNFTRPRRIFSYDCHYNTVFPRKQVFLSRLFQLAFSGDLE